MADDGRYKVHIDITITDETTGVSAPFSDFSATYYDCPRAIMHAIESAVSEALVDLGDQGIVLLGGDEAAALLEKQKALKAKK
jgi:methionine synthase II (cobalamin-independent)